MKSQFIVTTVALSVLLLGGCPTPTPAERMEQLGAIISVQPDGSIDLDLSGTQVTDDDMRFINAICANSGGKWTSVRTLDLSKTRITDKGLEFMAMQRAFAGPDGPAVIVLTGTQTSAASIAAIRQLWPDCEIKK